MAERPDPIVYPIGSQHLLIPARSPSPATGLLVRCVLMLLFWWALALLRLASSFAPTNGAPAGGQSRRRWLRDPARLAGRRPALH